MDFLNSIISSYNTPFLSAFLFGVMTAISPCPLATNITAVAYISKDIKTAKHTILNGLFYTLGRGISYTVLATLIYLGASSFSISSIFAGWVGKMIGPILIIISLFMFGVIRISFVTKSDKLDSLKAWFSTKGYLGSLALGALFALAFCPYSGALFFGMLIPLVLYSTEGLLLPPVFALGTGIPVILFSFLITLGLEKVSRAFNVIQKTEKIIRYTVASVFMVVGLYYCYYLLISLLR